MRLGVQHKLVQADDIWWRKDEVEIFERLREPEALQKGKKQVSGL
jgi:hypothetical protein